MKLEEIRKKIQKEMFSLSQERKEVILDIWRNQMSPIEVLDDLYSKERDLEKRIVDLEIMEVEEILGWIEERDFLTGQYLIRNSEDPRNSDGYLYRKFSQKLRYLKNVQEGLS